MECSCSCDVGDGEVATVYQCKTRRARKPHQCTECLRVIKPGEQYEHVNAMWDGEWAVIKTCLMCVAIRRDFGCGMHGSLREDVWDCLEIDIVSGALRDEDDQGAMAQWDQATVAAREAFRQAVEGQE